MSDYYKEMTSRNIGVFSESEQMMLAEATVAVAGCGCMGGLSIVLLARMGVGRLRIADPDVFEISNINRQSGANSSTVGQNKAEVMAEIALGINPSIELDVFPEHITAGNAGEFVSEADIVVDGIDYYRFKDALSLHRCARSEGLFVVTAVAIGFGANGIVFSPNGMTIEEFVGLPNNCDILLANDFTVPPEKYCPVLPPYASRDTVEKIASHEIEIPSISVAQAVGAGIIATQTARILTKKEPSLIAPDLISIQI